MRTFHLLVANSLAANVTNNFLWFALTFWVYLETRSVFATAIVGGGYMLLVAVSGMFFGTFVDRHRRRTSMLLSSAITFVAFALAGGVYALSPASALRDIAQPAFWAFIVLVLAGAIAGNLRMVALSTTVTLLVPEDGRDRANGLVGTTNGVVFAMTSVLSGFGVGVLGMGWSLAIAIVVHGPGGRAPPHDPDRRSRRPSRTRTRRASSISAARSGPSRSFRVSSHCCCSRPSTTSSAACSWPCSIPYGLSLMSVETYGIVLAITSSGFIVGGILVAKRGLGRNPVRTLLLANVVMWTVTILFPLRFEVLPLVIGFFIYLTLAPIAEASEQTIVQKVVPFEEQGRVFGFAQTVETAAVAGHGVPHRTDRPVLGAAVDDRRRAGGPDRAVVRHGPGAGPRADLHRRGDRGPDRDPDRAAIAPVPGALTWVPDRSGVARRQGASI